MRPFALGAAVGAAAALLAYWCVTSPPPAAAQFVRPGQPPAIAPNPPAVPAPPPPLPAVRQPVGTYQVGVCDLEAGERLPGGQYMRLVLLDTRTGELYRAGRKDLTGAPGWRWGYPAHGPPEWHKYIPAPPPR